jgi:hypothetical protein
MYYYLITISGTHLLQRGKYISDADRQSDLDLAIIDPSVDHIILLDPHHSEVLHAWIPSYSYCKERKDAWDQEVADLAAKGE